MTVLRIDHGKANAFDTELCRDISRALDTVASSGARAAVVTGRGNIFSAGVDLFRLIGDDRDAYLEDFLPALVKCFDDLLEFPLPLVGAVNGHAIAGGCILAASCDHRVMADGDGRIGAPELLVGVPFPVVALEILRMSSPAERLQEIVYTGGTWKASDAFARGLVDEVVPVDRIESRALEHARRLAAVPAASFQAVKRQLRAPAVKRRKDLAPLDEDVFATWRSDETGAAIQRYVDALTAKKGG